MEYSFAKKTGKSFRNIMLLAAGIFALGALLFFEIYRMIFNYSGLWLHKIWSDCDCAQMSQFYDMHPYISGTILFLGLAILSYFIYTVYQFVRLLIETRKFIKICFSLGLSQNPSPKLKEAVSKLNFDQNRIREINGIEPTVFCYGLLKPKICLSTGLIDLLQPDELEAVLLHEYYHLKSKEPLKLLLLKFFQKAFFFIPGLKLLAKRYITLSELAADELATENFSDRSKLARALWKVTENEEHQLKLTPALPFFSSTLEERVKKLTDNSYIPKFKSFGKYLVYGLTAVFAVSALLLLFVAKSTKAFEMHQLNECTQITQPESSPFCQSIESANTCDLSDEVAGSCRMN